MSQGGLYNEGAVAPPGAQGATACYPGCLPNPRSAFPNTPTGDAGYQAWLDGVWISSNVILGASSLGRWLLARAAARAAAADAALGAFSQRAIGSFILQSRSGLQGRTFVHEISVLAQTSAKEATRADFAHLAGTLTAEARAAGASAVEIRGVKVINPGVLRLQGLAKDLGFSVKEVGKDFITFTKAL